MIEVLEKPSRPFFDRQPSSNDIISYIRRPFSSATMQLSSYISFHSLIVCSLNEIQVFVARLCLFVRTSGWLSCQPFAIYEVVLGDRSLLSVEILVVTFLSLSHESVAVIFFSLAMLSTATSLAISVCGATVAVGVVVRVVSSTCVAIAVARPPISSKPSRDFSTENATVSIDASSTTAGSRTLCDEIHNYPCLEVPSHVVADPLREMGAKLSDHQYIERRGSLTN